MSKPSETPSPRLRVVTLSDNAGARLAAAERARWMRRPVALALTLTALLGIVLMAHSAYPAAAIVFLAVTLTSFTLRVRDGAVTGPLDSVVIGQAAERAVQHTLSTLDNRYILINGMQFTQPRGEIDHILIGPAGIVVLETKAFGDHITCVDGHWRRSRALPDGRLIDLYIGNPSRQVQREVRLLQARLHEQGAGLHYSEAIQGIVVLTHPLVELQADGCPVAVVRLSEIRAFIEQLPPRFEQQHIAQVAAWLIPHDPPMADVPGL